MRSLSFRASATRIDKAGRCLRRWALDELYGCGREETEALETGTELHDQQANYLRDGRAYDMSTSRDTGALALAAIHLLPRPRDPRILVESSFRSDLFGLPWEGTTDIRWEDRPAVWDHKTTTDFKYAKLPDALVKDIQACLYAHHEMRERGTDWCHLRWIYYRKKRKPYKAFASECVVTRATIAPTLERARRTLLRMYQVASERTPPMQLEHDARDCYAFNRECPHVSRCNLPIEENWSAFVGEIEESEFLNAIGHSATIAAKSQHLNPPAQDPPMTQPTNEATPGGWYQDAQGSWLQHPAGPPQNAGPPVGPPSFNPPQSGPPPGWSPQGPPNAGPPAGPPALSVMTASGVLASGLWPGIVFHPDPSTGAPAEYFHHANAPPNKWEPIPGGALTLEMIKAAPGCPGPAPQNAGPPPFGAPPQNAGPPPFGPPHVGPPVAAQKKPRKDALEKAFEHASALLVCLQKAKEATD